MALVNFDNLVIKLLRKKVIESDIFLSEEQIDDKVNKLLTDYAEQISSLLASQINEDYDENYHSHVDVDDEEYDG